ncbi:hypothetical protein ACFOEK_04545 [Litoribrevibacter euphylliae]|uniref:Glycine zipper 2TM domain-containing protein n=1 Tax=Litoribrevibacter euphylliae TaxID=1834034 RepID=A0ABV7H993_9GAMM
MRCIPFSVGDRRSFSSFLARTRDNMRINELLRISLLFGVLFKVTFVNAEPVYLAQEIQYGKVVTHQIYKVDPTYGRGALLGAITGAVIAENARGWGALGGAIVGAGLEGAITSGEEAHKVVVQLTNGQSFSIATPPNKLRQGDCVAVEQSGRGAEIFKVNYQFCQDAQKRDQQQTYQQANNPAPYQQDRYRDERAVKAEKCDDARSRLRYAKDSKYNRVLADVQRYCQD